MTEPLPSNVGYCTITGRFGETYVVSGVPQFDPSPDLFITFRAVPVLYDPGASPVPTILLPRDQVLRTDSAGFVVDDTGVRSPQIIASDDPDLTPSGWTYSVRVTGPAYTKRIRSFAMVAPAGASVDIGAYLGTTASPGHTADALALAIAQAMAAAANAAASAAAAAASAEEAANSGGGTGGGAPAEHTHPVSGVTSGVSDATNFMKNLLLNVADGPALRAASGAGTSNLTLGTSTGQAADAGTMATALSGKADQSAMTSALAAKANTTALSALDSSAVHKTTDETIAGIKTFSTGIVVPNASIPLAKISVPPGSSALTATDPLDADTLLFEVP